jgi:hypothetical protein
MPDQHAICSGEPEQPTCFALDRTKAAGEATPPRGRPDPIPPQVFAIMAATTMVTFGTLTSGYSLLF